MLALGFAEHRMPELDPEMLEAVVLRAQRQGRSRMRSLRSALPVESIAQRSNAIVDRLTSHPAFLHARGVALFWPILANKEVDLRLLDGRARWSGKALYYPFMEPRGDIVRTGFRRVDDPATLVERSMRFAEPPP